MYSLSIGIIIGLNDLLEEVRSAVPDLPVRVVLEQREIGDQAALVEKLDRVQPDVVLLGLQQLPVTLADFIRQVKATSGAPLVIVVGPSADPDAILRAVRAGADEYLYPPLVDDLRAALERMGIQRAELRAGTRPRGKILGFLSAKGGCGATTAACHIAVELQRLTRLHVLLADFDVDSGIVGFLMKSTSRYSILDAASSGHRLDLSLWKALVSNGQPGMEVIRAPENPGQSASVSPDNYRYILPLIRGTYDWSVLDLGRSLSPLALSLIEEVDESWLVTTLDIPALHRAKQIVQTLLQAGFDERRLHVLLNRTPKRMEVTLNELDRMLGVPIYATLPNGYPSLNEAYSAGSLLPPNSPLGRHFSRIAARIAGIEHIEKRKTFYFL